MITSYGDELTWTASAISGLTNSAQTLVLNGTTSTGGKVKDNDPRNGIGRDWGAGESLIAWFRATAALTGGTTFKIDIVGADDNALSVNAVVLATRTWTSASDPIAKDTLWRVGALRPGYRKRFLGSIFTTTGNQTAGNGIVGISPETALPQGGGASGSIASPSDGGSANSI